MSTIGPSLPAHLQSKRKYDDINRDERSSPISEDGDKRRRTIGPALPPAPLDERPTEPTVSEDSDSDGYGPAPALGVDDESSQNSLLEEQAHEEDAPSKPQRAEWMLAPPPGDDWTARVDPTRLRSRRFNTSKTAMPAPQAASESTLWTETPEQKKKRLRNEVLGIADPSQDPPKQAKRHDPANEKTKKRTMENSVRSCHDRLLRLTF